MSRNYILLPVTVILMYAVLISGQDTSNTITRNDFNFGHQLGYIYSRIDDAYFRDRGTWNFQTGFMSYYTREMPFVRNPEWKERLILMVPLYFEIYPSRNIALQLELTDLFVDFPYKDINNMGGKSTRFKTKIRLLQEKRIIPALALTMGVKFSNAKPYTIWKNDHNYDESNGLAGAGTGETDYLILLTVSKCFLLSNVLTAHLGLAPLGSPVPRHLNDMSTYSSQADEIPYGISYCKEAGGWTGRLEICGMYNGLPRTRLAHYSVARAQVQYRRGINAIILNGEHGLTRASDQWVLGFYEKLEFRIKSRVRRH